MNPDGCKLNRSTLPTTKPRKQTIEIAVDQILEYEVED